MALILLKHCITLDHHDIINALYSPYNSWLDVFLNVAPIKEDLKINTIWSMEHPWSSHYSSKNKTTEDKPTEFKLSKKQWSAFKNIELQHLEKIHILFISKGVYK